MGAWALLKARRDGKWDVEGGAIEREFFFRDLSPSEASAYADPKQWRIVHCPDAVYVGAVVTLTGSADDGYTVVWPDMEPA